MVESVDTRDLKSLGHCGCAGSSPASSTENLLCNFAEEILFYVLSRIKKHEDIYCFF